MTLSGSKIKGQGHKVMRRSSTKTVLVVWYRPCRS